MRILVLNHEYPPIGGGGGQSCKEIVEELAQRGHEIVVLTSSIKGGHKEESSTNVRVVRVASLRRYQYQVGFLGMAAFIVVSILKGFSIIKSWRPELFHVHFAVPAGISAMILHFFTGIPYLLTTHLGDVPGGVPDKTAKWFRWVFPFTIPVWKNAAKIVAVSEFTSALAIKNYRVSPIVIPNGIKLEMRENEVIKLNDPPVVIFAGRFVPQKNLSALLKILYSVRDLKWKCVMLGDGPLFQDIKFQIKSLGFSDRFQLCGWVSQNEVSSNLKKSDILLMPSLSEGLSVVGIQALAAGLAILANNVGGFCDLVFNNQNGFLASTQDTNSLSNALREYLSEPEKLLNARLSSLEIVKRFNIKNVVNHYENAFFSICEK